MMRRDRSPRSRAEARRRGSYGLLFAFALTAVAGAALAQPYPSKPIKIVVSTTPGGITDILARFLGAHITAKTGQAVIIDNRAGGSGNIAMSEVSRAAPDGYTLGFANTGNITINPYLFSKLNYDPLNDLIPIGPVGTVPLFLTVNASRIPATTLQEFIAYAKANMDKVSYAGAGAGTTPDLAAERSSRSRSAWPTSGHVRVDGPAHRGARAAARVLAAATPKRMPYVPDVPTFPSRAFRG